MPARDLTGVFLLNSGNREFAEGKGGFPFRETAGAIVVTRAIAKGAMILGCAATLAAICVYFYGVHEKEKLKESVKTVTASVSGCDGPGRFQNIRFHYTANGVEYAQTPFLRGTRFIGGSGMIDACTKGTVEVEYIADNPNRWSISPLTPLTRDELESEMPAAYWVTGPMLLLISGIFALTCYALRRNQSKRKRLRDEGIVLEAVLTKAEEDTSEDSAYNVRCSYQFYDPRGQLGTGTSSGYHEGISKKNLPPAGTRLLVIYVDERLHEAL